MMRLVTYPLWRGMLLLMIGAIGAMAGSWVSDRHSPVTPISVVALNPVIAPGGILRIRYELERTRSCASNIDRVLFDGDGERYNLEDLSYAAAPGPIGRDGYTVAIPIPRRFAKGRSTYRTVIAYECNVLHRLWPIIVRGEIPFEVVGLPVPDVLRVEIAPRQSK